MARDRLYRWRIVLDTSVLIAAFRSRRGAAWEVLRLVLTGEVIACLDLKLIYEYQDVAFRPEQLASSELDPVETEILLNRLMQSAEFVDVLYKYRPLSQDQGDDFVLDIAINGRVDLIVTHNVKHLALAARRFGIATMTPGEFLRSQARET